MTVQRALGSVQPPHTSLPRPVSRLLLSCADSEFRQLLWSVLDTSIAQILSLACTHLKALLSLAVPHVYAFKGTAIPSYAPRTALSELKVPP